MQMLIDLMCHVAQGNRALICAHNLSYARGLSDQVKGWCADLGLDPNNIERPISAESLVKSPLVQSMTRPGKGVCLFTDHHAWDDYSQRLRRQHSAVIKQAFDAWGHSNQQHPTWKDFVEKHRNALDARLDESHLIFFYEPRNKEPDIS